MLNFASSPFCGAWLRSRVTILGLTETVTAIVLTAAPFAAGVLYDREPALPFQVSLGLSALALGLVWRFAPRQDAHTPGASDMAPAQG